MKCAPRSRMTDDKAFATKHSQLGKPGCARACLCWLEVALSKRFAGPVQSTLASTTCSTHDADSHAPLSMLACTKAGDAHAVAVLLSEGDPPDATRDAFGRTPLLWAADGGSAVLVALLLAAGARVDAPDDDGGTPLLHATLCGHEHAARALLAAGADACAHDKDGCCATDVRPEEWSTWWPSCSSFMPQCE